MKLYKIRDWNRFFENNRSRELKQVNWIVVPNRHDGETFSAIMAHKNGAEIFAAWNLILQVASKCDPRGTLLRGGGKPHTPASLSLKTRAPDNWFKVAFDFLENQTDWIVVETVTDELVTMSLAGATIPQAPAESSIPFHSILSIPEGRGCKGKPNSIEAVIQECSNRKEPESVAREFWNYYESNGWRVGKNKMSSWVAALSGWISRNHTKPRNGYKLPIQERRHVQAQREFPENIVVKDI